MRKIKNNRALVGIILILILILVVLIGLTMWWGQSNQKIIQLINGTVLSTPHEIKPFKLINQNDVDFTNANLKEHWSVLFFGFTRCPTICPVTLSELNNVYRILEQEGFKNIPQVVFISVDPEHDTPTVLKKYLLSFNHHFTGLTGTKAEIDSLTKQLGIAYIKAIPFGKSNYEINHSGALIIINPSGKWEALITPPHTTATIVEDLKRLINK